MSPIDINKFNNILVPISYATNIKSSHWEYENEWRFMISKNNMGIPFSKAGFSNLKDVPSDRDSRYMFYDKNIVEEICLGFNFFNGRDFDIIYLKDKEIHITPKNHESNWNHEYQIKLLEFIIENLSDKFFVSGVKYERKDEEYILIRTKERINISKNDDQSYSIIRTNEVIKLM